MVCVRAVINTNPFCAFCEVIRVLRLTQFMSFACTIIYGCNNFRFWCLSRAERCFLLPEIYVLNYRRSFVLDIFLVSRVCASATKGKLLCFLPSYNVLDC